MIHRGHIVTAIARHPEKVPDQPGVQARRGDVFKEKELTELLAGHDAVISSVRFTASDPDKLLAAVEASGVETYIVVGGAGSLEVSPGLRLMDTSAFPEAYKAEAAAGSDFLRLLAQERELKWTFISPSATFMAGDRTGRFRIGQDELLSTEDGSRISFEDFAKALVDELESPAHVRERFTVGY